MVSQNSVRTDVAPGTTASERGFVHEVNQPVVESDFRSSIVGYVQPFWRSVIAGSLFAISLFVLSWYLMLGCHVGVDDNGLMHLGWGAGIWMCVTSCIAFYIGGAMSGALSLARNRDWALGAAIWGLTIPLAMLIISFASGNGQLLSHLNVSHANNIVIGSSSGSFNSVNYSFGYYWTVFIALGVGLIASILGSLSGSGMKTDRVVR
jgi:hypothetical protein